jgi:hypothetical protein
MRGLPDVSALPILGNDDPSLTKEQDMGKKRSSAPPQPVPIQPTPNAITIRGTDEWKGWLERFAAKMRSKPTAIIDLALAKLAEQERFEEPPPRMKP